MPVLLDQLFLLVALNINLLHRTDEDEFHCFFFSNYHLFFGVLGAAAPNKLYLDIQMRCLLRQCRTLTPLFISSFLTDVFVLYRLRNSTFIVVPFHIATVYFPSVFSTHISLKTDTLIGPVKARTVNRIATGSADKCLIVA